MRSGVNVQMAGDAQSNRLGGLAYLAFGLVLGVLFSYCYDSISSGGWQADGGQPSMVSLAMQVLPAVKIKFRDHSNDHKKPTSHNISLSGGPTPETTSSITPSSPAPAGNVPKEGPSADAKSPRFPIATCPNKFGWRRQLRADAAMIATYEQLWAAHTSKTPAEVKVEQDRLWRSSTSFRTMTKVHLQPGSLEAKTYQVHNIEEEMKDIPKMEMFWNVTTRALNDLKIVLAVPSATRQCEVRNLHRRTWMQHPSVCKISEYTREGCVFFPVFIFANVSEDLVEEDDGSLIFLRDIPAASALGKGPPPPVDDVFKFDEGNQMWLESNLKTPVWFDYAVTNFPWATHLGKMDMDCLPYPDFMLNDLVRAPVGPFRYGIIFPNGGFVGAGGLYGQLYIMSAEITKCIQPFLYPKPELGGQHGVHQHFTATAEDQVMYYLQVIAEQFLKCPAEASISVYAGGRWKHNVEGG